MGIFLSELNTYYKTFFKTSSVWLVRRHMVHTCQPNPFPQQPCHKPTVQAGGPCYKPQSASDLCVHTPSTEDMLDG